MFLTGVPALGQPPTHLLDTAPEFFAPSPQDKAAVRWSGEGAWSGWQPLFDGAGPQALLLERYERALPAPDGFPTRRDWARKFDQRPESPSTSSTRGPSATHMRTLATLVTSMLGQALTVPQAGRRSSSLVVARHGLDPTCRSGWRLSGSSLPDDSSRPEVA